MGIKDLKKKYDLKEIIKGDSIFCATGITDGDLVKGINVRNNKYISETLVTHKSSNMCKIVIRRHYKNLINIIFYNKRSKFGPFVYRLGHVVFILERGFEFP